MQSWLEQFRQILASTARRIRSDAAGFRNLLCVRASHAKTPEDYGFDAFRLLGSHSRLSDEALRQRYHRIVREIHPDRLQALGASMGMIRRAEYVLAEINHAYDAIARRRGLK